MFRWSSEQTCEVSETAVMLDIMMKGWICSKWSRDSIVDISIPGRLFIIGVALLSICRHGAFKKTMA